MDTSSRGVGWSSLDSSNRGTVVRSSVTEVSFVSDLPSSISALGCMRSDAANSGGTPQRFRGPRRYRGCGRLHRRNVRSCKKRGQSVGKSRAGLATKVMALTDRDGFPLSIHIADGNRHDISLTDATLDAAFVAELPPRLIADKAWDSNALRVRLREERDIELISPNRRCSRKSQDKRPLRRYKRRWKVERFFAWLKRFRRLGTRYEYKAENFLALLLLGCVVFTLKKVLKQL